MSRKTIRVVPKDYRPIVRAALDAGWAQSQTRHGHLKLTGPDGHAVAIPSSSTNPRTLETVKSNLRRHGVEL